MHLVGPKRCGAGADHRASPLRRPECQRHRLRTSGAHQSRIPLDLGHGTVVACSLRRGRCGRERCHGTAAKHETVHTGPRLWYRSCSQAGSSARCVVQAFGLFQTSHHATCSTALLIYILLHVVLHVEVCGCALSSVCRLLACQGAAEQQQLPRLPGSRCCGRWCLLFVRHERRLQGVCVATGGAGWRGRGGHMGRGRCVVHLHTCLSVTARAILVDLYGQLALSSCT